jgi:pimeloyl-ACP methyl ester carboxylesterase
MTSTRLITTENASVRVTERGAGRPVLLLHGGAGPMSVAAFADRLAAERPARVITPTHPGFDGTDRPAGVGTIRELAAVYADLLDVLELDDVTVVGNSIGGWIAAELGLLRPKRVSGLVVVDAVGIEVPGQPIADFFALTFPETARLSYADPAAAPPPPPMEAMAGNRATLRTYAGEPSMADPTLRARLAGMDLPTLVVWGEADGIAGPGYGRAFAAAIPGAEFLLLPATGHLPQLESPERLLGPLWAFIDEPERRAG